MYHVCGVTSRLCSEKRIMGEEQEYAGDDSGPNTFHLMETLVERPTTGAWRGVRQCRGGQEGMIG